MSKERILKLITAGDNEPISHEDGVWLLEEYIRIRKGRVVSIRPTTDPFSAMRYGEMVTYAINWLRVNRDVLDER